jgi:hypothetical protein
LARHPLRIGHGLLLRNWIFVTHDLRRDDATAEQCILG